MASKKWSSPKLGEQIKKTISGQKFITIFDLETTGLSPANDRIIEFAGARFAIGKDCSLSLVDEFATRINPGRPVPEKITDLTGITDAMLKRAPDEKSAALDILDFLGEGVFGGYNVRKFDLGFITAMAARHGEEFHAAGVVDAFEMAKDLIEIDKASGPENHKLKTIANYFGIDFHAHSAMEDVKACGEITRILLSEYMAREAKQGRAGKQPEILKVAFWEGFKGYSRIYVETKAGTVYYDARSGRWGEKDAKIDDLDMEYIENAAFGLAGCANADEFKRFKGTAKAISTA
jgi:DNA polymerase III alpha subunit (gram-positive type)